MIEGAISATSGVGFIKKFIIAFGKRSISPTQNTPIHKLVITPYFKHSLILLYCLAPWFCEIIGCAA